MASIGDLSLTDWIPGQGDTNRAQPTPSRGKQWVGNVQLPDSYTLVHAGNGYYDVMDGTKRAGVLQPGGNNGVFNRDPNYQRGLQTQRPQDLYAAPDGTMAGPTQRLGNSGPDGRKFMANPWETAGTMSPPPAAAPPPAPPPVAAPPAAAPPQGMQPMPGAPPSTPANLLAQQINPVPQSVASNPMNLGGGMPAPIQSAAGNPMNHQVNPQSAQLAQQAAVANLLRNGGKGLR